MEGYRLIDQKTAAKLRMTEEEERAVVELWAIQNRMSVHGGAHVGHIPSGLVLPPADVKSYLTHIRSGSARRYRPARTLGADVRLAFLAACVLIVAAIAFNAMLNRRASYPAPDYVYTPQASVAGYTQTLNGGLLRTSYGGALSDDYLIRRSARPERLIFVNGSNVFERFNNRIEVQPQQLRSWLHSVVGGPLARQSSPAASPITSGRAKAAIAAHRSGSPTMDAGRLVIWERIRVAYGGRITQVEVPYAKLSDKPLVDAVASEQKRIIDEMAKTVRHLGLPIAEEAEGVAR